MKISSDRMPNTQPSRSQPFGQGPFSGRAPRTPHDRAEADADTIAEWDVCQELGIEVVTGVGADKQWSSSWFLDAWAQAAH